MKNYVLKLTLAVFFSLFVQSCSDESTTTCPYSTSDVNKRIVEQVVHSQSLGLSGIFKEVTDTMERHKIIRELVYSSHFFSDSSGYLFVVLTNGIVIANGAVKAYEYQNLINLQDSRGFYFIQAFIQSAKNGGGWTEYWWKTPQETTERRKLGYVEPIPGTEYFIGSGFYAI